MNCERQVPALLLLVTGVLMESGVALSNVVAVGITLCSDISSTGTRYRVVWIT